MSTVVAAALGNALIAYWQFFAVQSGAGLQDVFAGSFENRNHFGFMMTLGIFSAIGLLSCIKKDASRRMPHLPAWLKLRIPLIFITFLLVIAQVLSLSRGAFLSMTIIICLYSILWWLSSSSSNDGRKIVVAVFIMLLGALLFSLQTGLSMLAERYQTVFEQDIFDADTRISFWKDTISMANHFPLTGAGLGAYRDVFQVYESGKVINVLADHAHNDWLELLAETGWPATMLLLAGIAFLLAQAGKRLWQQKEPTLRWLGFAAMAAILAGMIHECFDFNLQAMSNAILFSMLMAVFFACARKTSNENNKMQQIAEYSRLHPRRIVFLIVALMLLFVILPKQIKRVQAALISDHLESNLLNQMSFSQPQRKDYQRWLEQVNKALQITSTSGRLHFWKALCSFRLAELTSFEDSTQHWETSMAAIAKACQRFPNKGEFLLDCAEIYEFGSLRLALPIKLQILDIYQRAWQCQPRLVPTLLRVSDAYRRIYWQMLADDTKQQETESLRQQTLLLFSEFLQLTPHRANEIFTQIMEICTNQEEVLALAPKNLLLQRELLQYLTNRHVYDKALQLLENNKIDWMESAADKNSLFYSRDWHEWKYTLLGLTQQWSQRQELWKPLHNLGMRCLERKIPPLPVDANTDLMQQNELTFATLLRQPPHSCKVLKKYVEWQAHFGHQAEISSILLPMVCNFHPMPLDCLLKTKDLLNLTPDSKHIANAHSKFLETALNVCIAEQQPQQKITESVEWLQNLRDSETALANDDKRSAWLQQHLYPLFEGRIHCLRQEFAAAAEAYQRSQQYGEKNLLVWTHQQKLPLQFQPTELPDWALALQKGMPLNFFFTNSVALLTARPSQTIVSNFHESIEIDFFWLCNGDVLEDCQIHISFQNPSGVIFTDTFSFIELQKPMVNWKVGEIISCTRTYRPLLQTVQKGQMVSDSNIVASIQLTSLFKNSKRVYRGFPTATFPIMTMKKPQ